MGSIQETREITLIDDVLASGRSKVWAIEELKKDGLEVKRVLVVVDREQGGEKVLEKIGCPVYGLYRISELIDYFASRGKLDPDTARAALEHIRSKRSASSHFEPSDQDRFSHHVARRRRERPVSTRRATLGAGFLE